MLFNELNTETETLAAKAMEFLAHAVRSDGRLPMLGDTEHLALRIHLVRHLQNDALEHFLFATTPGQNGIKPPETCKVYTEYGYAFFRTTWDYSEDAQNVMHFVVKGGALGRFHYHQDEGTLLLYAFGEDWLIDSGMYSYNNDDCMRTYMRSRRAHNVPEIRTAKYFAKLEERFSAWLIKSQENATKLQLDMKFGFL